MCILDEIDSPKIDTEPVNIYLTTVQFCMKDTGYILNVLFGMYLCLFETSPV